MFDALSIPFTSIYPVLLHSFKNNVVASSRFKKDLKVVINKVLMERMTLTELDNLNLDSEEGPKKVLKP